MVTFHGGKPVTLTIAVSNYDHFYGGIVYPPAFGTMLAVNTTRGIRFAFCLFGCTVTFVCALLSFYFSRRMKQNNTSPVSYTHLDVYKRQEGSFNSNGIPFFSTIWL